MEIECTKRTYRIRTSEGVIMEIEVDKPLSERITSKLIEEDDLEILLNCKIISVDTSKKEDKEGKKKSPRKIIKKKKKELEVVSEEKEIKESDESGSGESGESGKIKTEGPEVLAGVAISPIDRINLMLKMEGEFTREDYQRMIEMSGHKISNFMGHDDIKDAILLEKIEHLGGKGNVHRRYRVTDTEPIDKLVFRRTLKNRRRNTKIRRKTRNKTKIL